jgi:chaperonin GroEL
MNDMILKDITSGPEAKKKLLSGINKLADVVGSTHGYRGRTVLIESIYGMPEPTKDGYKTLQAINLDEPVEAMACKVAKEASQRTVDLAGDATTSTIVLLQAFFTESLKALEAGKSAIDIKHEIEKSRDKIVAYLDEISQELTDEDIYNVALTSANGEEELAKIVSEAFIKAGENGAVSHLRSNTHETHLDFIDGTLLEAGYASDLLINNYADRTCEFKNNPLIVCSNIVFKSFDTQVLPFIKFAMQNERQLVLVADWTDSASFGIRDSIIRNVVEKKLPIVLVNAPSFGNKRRDFMSDLAMMCGTQFLSSLSGDMFVGREAQFLGTCESIIVGKTDTIIVPHKNGEEAVAVESKIEELKSQLAASKSELEKKYIKDRISKLAGGISIIKVGSIIESELQELTDRVDDAVCAVRSAKEEGVVAGGGVALYNSARLDLDPVSNIAVVAPLNKILSNADVDGELCLGEYPMGYDVKNYKECNMIEAGILDATKAIKHALINAVAASNTLLMTNVVLTNQIRKISSHD